MIVPAIGFDQLGAEWQRFPSAVQQRLERQGVNASNYATWRARVAEETDRRERDGEGDHLIHYALLGRAFTKLPPIEPALSARRFVEEHGIPADAQLRLNQFAAAMQLGTTSERLVELQQIAKGRDLQTEYARAMRFLYAKEFQHQTSYAGRGHSTDTSVAANYAVWQGLQVLHAVAPSFTVHRVLIIGPGLDFAPRTALVETARPQSYQPFAVLDTLLALHFGTPVIHCWDINPRVIRFFQNFAADPILKLHADGGTREYLTYFHQLGSQLGAVHDDGTTRTMTVSPEYARAVTAENRNIVTGEPASGYDLVIATNVLLYYEGPELTVALAHIARSLTAGGYFLHNDLRPELDAATQAAGLQAVAARTVQVSASTFDSFALYTL